MRESGIYKPDESNLLQLEDSRLKYQVLPQKDADKIYHEFPSVPRSYHKGCPSCGKNRGEYHNGVVILNNKKYLCNCQDQLQRYKHYLNAGVGLTYQTLSWNDYHGDVEAGNAIKKYISNIDEMVSEHKWVFLFSETNGVGKTMLATLLAKGIVQAGYKTYFTTWASALETIKAGWSNDKIAGYHHDKIYNSTVLIIDDVGKEMQGLEGHNDNFSRQTLGTLLRQRRQRGLTTIITSNYHISDFSGTYGYSTYALFEEGSHIIKIEGDSYRMNKKTPQMGYRRIY